MSCDGSIITWDFIRTAIASVAKYAVFPMQDLLGLDNSARMNTPGVAAGNWAWRYKEGVLNSDMAARLKEVCTLFGRTGIIPEVEEDDPEEEIQENNEN